MFMIKFTHANSLTVYSNQNKIIFSQNGAVSIYEGDIPLSGLGFGYSGKLGASYLFRDVTAFTWTWEKIYIDEEYSTQNFKVVGYNNYPLFPIEQTFIFDANLPMKFSTRMMNGLTVPISDFKVWYIHTVEDGQEIIYNDTSFYVNTSETLFLHGDFSDILPKVDFKDKYFFNYNDLIETGYTPSDILIGDMGLLNIKFSGISIMAVGIKDDFDYFVSHEIKVYDPIIDTSASVQGTLHPNMDNLVYSDDFNMYYAFYDGQGNRLEAMSSSDTHTWSQFLTYIPPSKFIEYQKIDVLNQGSALGQFIYSLYNQEIDSSATPPEANWTRRKPFTSQLIIEPSNASIYYIQYLNAEKDDTTEWACVIQNHKTLLAKRLFYSQFPYSSFTDILVGRNQLLSCDAKYDKANDAKYITAIKANGYLYIYKSTNNFLSSTSNNFYTAMAPSSTGYEPSTYIDEYGNYFLAYANNQKIWLGVITNGTALTDIVLYPLNVTGYYPAIKGNGNDIVITYQNTTSTNTAHLFIAEANYTDLNTTGWRITHINNTGFYGNIRGDWEYPMEKRVDVIFSNKNSDIMYWNTSVPDSSCEYARGLHTDWLIDEYCTMINKEYNVSPYIVNITDGGQLNISGASNLTTDEIYWYPSDAVETWRVVWNTITSRIYSGG